ncbi:MAG: SPOR domain-containing protein [Calditrichaceae bacterium]|nr:SPOR domain-containing protein [Calditrichaceae bacterium]MBN2708456.1 SPOR domain-containing protein [Calditrichaceae bacterium]RQV93070.1 MAG: SPOR domain-containing protein [Calditrichota bacterium]
MKAYIIFLILLIGLINISCNTSLIKKKSPKPEPTASVDSVLFYQQEDLPDPLIDAVLSGTDEDITISKTLIPPPPPKPKFKQIEGFRIQVYAGADSLSALTGMYELKKQTQYSVYLISEKGLYKLQVGDYAYRIDADAARQKMRTAGYEGAWVVKTMINVPVEPAEPVSYETPSDNNMNNKKITIQVLALSSKQDAEMMADELKTRFNMVTAVKSAGDLYKVFVGEFSTKEEAEAALKTVRTNGFPDAWLVY